MMHECHDDPILRHVSRLPALTPSQQRANRVRARCRAKLAPPTPKQGRVMEPALLAGFCLLYLSAIVHDVLQFRASFFGTP
jgi:hypothetical protein